MDAKERHRLLAGGYVEKDDWMLDHDCISFDAGNLIQFSEVQNGEWGVIEIQDLKMLNHLFRNCDCSILHY